jgi:AcrR family transcriptional regulator
MGIRELQKNVRRRAILDAAQMLMQEGKSRDFSMPNLAQRAGVSLVTPRPGGGRDFGV